MARMSREFNLVLLGAGLLTAGYFLMPSEDAVRADDQVADAQNGGGGSRSRRGGTVFIITRYSYTSSRVASTSAVARSGFGGSGARFSAGG